MLCLSVNKKHEDCKKNCRGWFLCAVVREKKGWKNYLEGSHVWRTSSLNDVIVVQRATGVGASFSVFWVTLQQVKCNNC